MDFEIIPASDFGEIPFGRIHRKLKYAPVASEPFEVLTMEELRKAITPEMQSAQRKWRAPNRAALMDERSVCFIDGEGGNNGLPELRIKKLLQKRVQQQNYALLGVAYDDGRYESIIGKDRIGQLSTRDCLEFILRIPKDHVIISFGFGYDVEMILRDLGIEFMKRLHAKRHQTYWGDYKIVYIPHKYFYIRHHNRKTNTEGEGRTIYDIAGFFGNVNFKTVTETWKVATPEEQAFLERMKGLRSTFGPITQETLDYNALEGKLGIRVFQKIRSEWVGLGLHLKSPHGAGNLSSAMFLANHIEDYMHLQQAVLHSPFKSAYIGGRFDFSRQGLFEVAYEADINSAYPFIMSTLPCLTHCRIEWTRRYTPDQHSLWLVQWRDTGQRWALFPYRSHKHIRYHSSGVGWYYGSEVAAALRLDPTLEILEGYRIIPGCDEKPFGWIEAYYNRRQELKSTQPFAAEVLKIGMNAGYGKLAQTKGFVPKYQNLIWAGMITSGTRAMLLDAIFQHPEAIIAVSTDSVTSTKPLMLDYHDVRLGAWKRKQFENYLLLGNGFAYSTSRDSDGRLLKDTHRGFISEEWNWEIASEEWSRTGSITAWKRRFNTAYDAWIQHDKTLRCSWTDYQSKLDFELPPGRIADKDGWIWPSENPTPLTLSEEVSVDPQNLRISQFGSGDFVVDWEDKEKVSLVAE